MVKNVGIIGLGKVGSALALKLFDIGRLNWVCSESGNTNHIKNIIDNVNLISSIDKYDQLPEVIFLTVTDKEIEKRAIALAKKNNDLTGTIIVHCSGSLDSSALTICSAAGAITASAHPFQTFYYPSAEILDGIGWGLESKGDITQLFELISEMGGNPIDISHFNNEQRRLYHCSAVVASNYMNTIFSLAGKLAKAVNIDKYVFLEPIIRTTVQNNLESKDTVPITGPIVRGDIEAIKGHLKSLDELPELKRAYADIGKATISILKLQEGFDFALLSEIDELLS